MTNYIFPQEKIVLGSGTFAEIILIYSHDGKKLALKCYKFEEDLNEIDILHRANHPNIIKPIDIIKYENKISIVLPYYQHDLYKMIDHVPKSKIEPIIKGITSALDYLHYELNICHGDIKPSNIMISEDFIPIIIDFSIAFHVSSYALGYKSCGVYPYISPQASDMGKVGDKFDVMKSQIYSIGCIWYELEHGEELLEWKQKLTHDDCKQSFLHAENRTRNTKVFRLVCFNECDRLNSFKDIFGIDFNHVSPNKLSKILVYNNKLVSLNQIVKILFDWMYNVFCSLRNRITITFRSLILSIRLFIRVSHFIKEKRDIQLIGIVCLYICTHVDTNESHELMQKDTNFFLYVCASQFSQQEFDDMKYKILKETKWIFYEDMGMNNLEEIYYLLMCLEEPTYVLEERKILTLPEINDLDMILNNSTIEFKDKQFHFSYYKIGTVKMYINNRQLIIDR